MRIIQKMHGIDGKLSRSNSMLLDTLLHQPSLLLWRSARNMVICDQPLITLSAAVQAATRGKLVIGEIPDTFTLYRALKYSVEIRKRCFHNMEVCDTES
ncbi:MAG TPA: hypothetical protein VIM41_12265 [Gammaproteobacteria bacterium]